MFDVKKYYNMTKAVYERGLLSQNHTAGLVLASSLLALSLAAPAAAKNVPPVPTLVDHINLGWGTHNDSVFTGEIGENEVFRQHPEINASC